MKSVYEIFIRDTSKLDAFFTGFDTLKFELGVEKERGMHHLTAHEFVKTEVFTNSGIACTLYSKNFLTF